MGEGYCPTGQAAVVAVMKMHDYGIEDPAVVSKASVERGLFRSTMRRKYISTAKTTSTDRQFFGVPNMDWCNKYRDNSKRALNPLTGAPDPHTQVEADVDAVIGKYSRTKSKSSEGGHIGYVDQSVTTKKPGVSRVDEVRTSTALDGSMSCTVITRQHRMLEIGDKLTDRHAQKGTVSLMPEMQDMPFTANGLVPDVIVSPDQFPSRMTEGKLIEMIGGKVAALTGERVDLTPFRELGPLGAELLKHGKHWSGKEVFYDPITGRKMQNPVMVGIVDMEKLRHMVCDKIHSRARGPMLFVLQQPVEGRGREGALRLGEMERDTLLAHGAPAVLNDRLHKCSDGKIFVMCPVCGSYAETLPSADEEEGGMEVEGVCPAIDPAGTQAVIPRLGDRSMYCRNCANSVAQGLLPRGSTQPVREMAMPQAMYLFKNYLEAMQLGLALHDGQPAEGDAESAGLAEPAEPAEAPEAVPPSPNYVVV